jgi:hypothetical protein
MFTFNKLSLGVTNRRRSPLVRLRHFLGFDPVLNSYGELATAWTPTGNFEAGLNFSTTSSAAQTLFGGELAGTDEIRLEINTSGFVVASAYVGTALQTAITSTVALDNGKFHSAKIVYTGTTAELFVNDVSIGTQTWALNGNQTIKYVGRLSTGAYFAGVLANPVLTDVTTPANSQAYDLDKATGTTESSTVNSGTLTYHNIPEANRFQAQLIGADWVGTTELVVNGDFASDTGWTKGTGWTIAGGVASCDGSQTSNSELAVNPDLSIFAGAVFNIGYTLIRSAGAISFVHFGGATVNVDADTSGVVTNNFVTTDAVGDLRLAADPSFIGSIDNVTAKRILEAP